LNPAFKRYQCLPNLPAGGSDARAGAAPRAVACLENGRSQGGSDTPLPSVPMAALPKMADPGHGERELYE
jgi:hypothetical protein